MPVIYIAGPFRGKTAWEVENNIRAAETLGFTVAARGGIPLIPHTMYRFFDGTQTDEFWLDGTLELLKRCDAILMVPGWEKSSGSCAEKAYAESVGMPVLFSVADLKAYLDGRQLISANVNGRDVDLPRNCRWEDIQAVVGGYPTVTIYDDGLLFSLVPGGSVILTAPGAKFTATTTGAA